MCYVATICVEIFSNLVIFTIWLGREESFKMQIFKKSYGPISTPGPKMSDFILHSLGHTLFNDHENLIFSTQIWLISGPQW